MLPLQPWIRFNMFNTTITTIASCQSRCGGGTKQKTNKQTRRNEISQWNKSIFLCINTDYYQQVKLVFNFLAFCFSRETECGFNNLTYKEMWRAPAHSDDNIEKCQREKLINHRSWKEDITILSHPYASYHPNSWLL